MAAPMVVCKKSRRLVMLVSFGLVKKLKMDLKKKSAN
jgi:hypothetical protein